MNFPLECKIEVEADVDEIFPFGDRVNVTFSLYINGAYYASEEFENVEEGDLEELARDFVSGSGIDAGDIANNLE